MPSNELLLYCGTVNCVKSVRYFLSSVFLFVVYRQAHHSNFKIQDILSLQTNTSTAQAQQKFKRDIHPDKMHASAKSDFKI